MSNRYAILSVLTVQEATRFWTKIHIAGPNECWLWHQRTDKKGYGSYAISRYPKVRLLIASRVAYALHYGVDPLELDVLHTCDNPPCCNPAHLFPGTNQNNIEDRISKGRSATGDKHWSHKKPELVSKGESHGMSSLSEYQAREILSRYDGKRGSIRRLAQEYGVCAATVGYLVSRKTWKHL